VVAELFGVNRHTVRHAIASLVENGLVRTRRGAGVFVISAPTEYPLSARVRFHQNILAGGQSPERRALYIQERPASKQAAQALGIAVRAPVCVFHGVSLADGHPIALFLSHFPTERLPGIAQALTDETSVTRALRRCGVADYTRISTKIGARSASATQGIHLHIPEGAPLIYSTSVNADAAGSPVEYGQTWFVGERVTLTLDEPE